MLNIVLVYFGIFGRGNNSIFIWINLWLSIEYFLFHRVIDLTESDGVLNGDVAICELILGQHLYYQQQICKNCKNFDQTIKVEPKTDGA
jgi:hypothetical protein